MIKIQNSKLKIKNLSSDLERKNQKLEELIDQLEKELKEVKKKYHKLMRGYRFSQALGLIYDFSWHRLADFYIEQLKKEIINGNIKALEKLSEVYFEILKMIHPFAPFISEAIWKIFYNQKSLIS